MTGRGAYTPMEIVSPPLSGVAGLAAASRTLDAAAALHPTVSKSCGMHVHGVCFSALPPLLPLLLACAPASPQLYHPSLLLHVRAPQWGGQSLLLQ